VWLHGFTQTRASAHQFRSILAGSFDVETLDLPGHGENASLGASLLETAQLLLSSLGDEPYVLAGYSFGARVALHAALTNPEQLRGLILLGSTRGIADEHARAERRANDEILATRLETEGVDAFLDYWLALPMFASLPVDSVERSARSTDAEGLARSLRLAGTGTQEWLGERLKELRVPTLVMAGERDEKFSLEARAMNQSLPNSELYVVPGANHAAHLEAPANVAHAIVRFSNQS